MNQEISSLNLPSYIIQKLRLAGFNCVKDVNLKNSNIKSEINEREWQRLTSTPSFKSALDVYEEEVNSGKVSTFIKELDDVLNGGISIGKITEICGLPGSGRTQTCFQLCINVQFPQWCGGPEGEAIYITTNNNFASHRMREMAENAVKNYEILKQSRPNTSRYVFNIDTIMRRIHVMNITNYVELCASPIFLKRWLHHHPGVRLLIVDSISSPLKELEYTELTNVVYKFLSELQSLANKYKFGVVLVNDFTTRLQKDKCWYNTPSLGYSYSHRINTRIELSKLNAGTFRATVVKGLSDTNLSKEFKLNV